MISGARYSGVPQKVLVVSVPISPSFERPKSVSTTCPKKKIKIIKCKQKRSKGTRQKKWIN